MSGFLRGLRPLYRRGPVPGPERSRRRRGLRFRCSSTPIPRERRQMTEGPSPESDGMLTGEMLRTFQQHARTGFRAFDAAKRSYLLGANTCLIVDDDIETALQVVREKQTGRTGGTPGFRRQSPGGDRRTFGREGEDGAMARRDRRTRTPEKKKQEARAAALFVETPEYADRAIGIRDMGEAEPGFPASIPRTSGCRDIRDRARRGLVRLDEEAVAELRKAVDAAIEAGAPGVNYRGQTYPGDGRGARQTGRGRRNRKAKG